ncbi:MAG: GAF domain-containing protein [Chloroflexi bacterium]|nr:GAF domain-containing protein [Chloroflexota bacterium]
MITRLAGLFRQIFSIHYPYTNPIERHWASVMFAMNWATVSGVVLWLLATATLPFAAEIAEARPALATIPLLALGVHAAIYWAIQNGRARLAAAAFTGVMLANVVALTIFLDPQQPTISGTTLTALVIPVVAAGLLLKRPGIVILAAAVGAVLLGALGQSQITRPIRLVPAQTVAADVVFLVSIVVVVFAFGSIFSGKMRQVAEEALADIRQRQWTVELGIELGKTPLAESAILARAMIVLRDQFKYSYAQVYRLDEDRNHLFRAMTTSMSRYEIAGRDRLNLAAVSALAECARTRQPVLVASGAAGSGHLRATSRFGLAVPIQHAGSLLGVLDIQTDTDTPFSANQIETAGLFAGMLGTTLANAHLLEDLQRQLAHQETTAARLQEQLVELQRREQHRVGDTWGAYLQERGAAALGFDFQAEEGTPVPARDLPDDLRRTLEQGAPYIEERGDERIIHVPITFRNQTLGAMAFTLPANQELTSRQLEMAQVVSERLALALENMRLFEQSQSQAQREYKAGRLTSQLIGAKDVSALLDLAAEQFNEALGAVHTRIYLQPDLLAEPAAAPGREEPA